MTVWAHDAPPSSRPTSHRGNHHHQQQQQQQQCDGAVLVNKAVDKWLSDEHCTTVLCQPNGQVPTTNPACDRPLRYDGRCYFNVRSKADMSQLNLLHGTNS